MGKLTVYLAPVAECRYRTDIQTHDTTDQLTGEASVTDNRHDRAKSGKAMFYM